MGVKIIPGGDQLCWALLPNEPHLPPVPPLGVKTGPGGGWGVWVGWVAIPMDRVSPLEQYLEQCGGQVREGGGKKKI